MRILLVSEGGHELGAPEGESALEVLCRRLLDVDAEFVRMTVRDPEVRVHIRAGKADGYERRGLAWLRYAEREGFDALVFVVDHDNDHRRPAQLDLVQESTAFGLPRAYGVAVRTFDAWMLADEQALSQVLRRTIPRQRDPEAIGDPKGICEKLRDDSPGVDDRLRDMYAAISHVMDLKLLSERCSRGFKTFAQRVRALSPH